MPENEADSPAYFLMMGNHVYYLTQEIIKIGRSEDNDLLFTDLRVSRTHAKVSNIDGSYLLSDLNSSGGTHVNGRPVVQKLLQPGDVITLGTDVKIIFHTATDFLPQNTTEYKPDTDQGDQAMSTGALLMPDE